MPYIRVDWKFHRLTKMLTECVQRRFLFQHSVLFAVYISSISVAVLGSHWSKSHQQQICHHMNFSAHPCTCLTFKLMHSKLNVYEQYLNIVWFAFCFHGAKHYRNYFIISIKGVILSRILLSKRHLWCNDYHHRKWIWLFAFHIALLLLGKA